MWQWPRLKKLLGQGLRTAAFHQTSFGVSYAKPTRLLLREFKQRYGEHRAIAALAVIVEDEASGKKRVIHDATHGVRVNHRIRCRDKLRAPGAREKKCLLLELQEEDLKAFSVVGDIAKAHRRYLRREDERGYLGCHGPATGGLTQSHPPPARGVLPCRHAPVCGRPGDARRRSTRPAGDPVELHLPGGHGLPLQVAKDVGLQGGVARDGD